MQEVPGLDPGFIKEISVLIRIGSWRRDGLAMEADRRHAEILARDLPCSHDVRHTVVIPGISDEDATTHRTCSLLEPLVKP